MTDDNARRRHGDRRDARLLRDIDSMHFFTPYLFPGRTSNEAFISEQIELSAINAYLADKNADDPEHPYTLFQVIIMAMVKTCTLRPKMNRFIKNNRMYQRDAMTAAFVMKKEFSDEAREGLAFLSFDGEATMDSTHDAIVTEIVKYRDQEVIDSSTDSMDTVMKLPRPVVGLIAWAARRLDEHGRVPQAWIATDPYQATLLLTNLGSIKLNSGYHHLANWGTNSVFVVVGEKKLTPFYDETGNVTMKETVDLGLTIDERIAEGYYYAKTVRLLKHLLANPSLLDLPADEIVDY